MITTCRPHQEFGLVASQLTTIVAARTAPVLSVPITPTSGGTLQRLNAVSGNSKSMSTTNTFQKMLGMTHSTFALRTLRHVPPHLMVSQLRYTTKTKSISSTSKIAELMTKGGSQK